MRCLEVYDEWEGAGGDETADDLADRVATKNKKLKEEVDGFRKRPAYAAVIWERDCLKEENEQLKESINRL